MLPTALGERAALGHGCHDGDRRCVLRTLRRRAMILPMPKEKEPGMVIEEAKSRLRIEEADTEAERCAACQEERKASGDATAYCATHLKKIYGV
jgi:hypothetical protein